MNAPDSFSLAELARLAPEIRAKLTLALPRELAQQLAAEPTDREDVLGSRHLEMPVLAGVAREFDDDLFADLRLVFVLHFVHDLLYFLSFFEDAGLGPERALVLYKEYPYRSKELVQQCLRDWGYTIAPVARLSDHLGPFLAANPGELLIVEDGGYVVPFIHEHLREALPETIGAVEQTAKGQWRDEELSARGILLDFPVLSIARSRIKSDFEPAGVARAVWSNIRNLCPNVVWSGQTVMVVGYGTIGRAVAQHLQAERTNVLVCDRRRHQLALAALEGFETVETIARGLAGRRIQAIIGATGQQSIDRDVIALLPDGVRLVSASSDQVEIGLPVLQELGDHVEVAPGVCEYGCEDGRRLVLLADGYPVNFYGADSVQNQLIDLVMSELFLGAAYLAENPGVLEPGVDAEVINRISADVGVVDRFYDYHYAG